jgi:hypothetical protein
MTIHSLKRVSDLSRDNSYVKRVSFHGTATAGQTSYIGGFLSFESYMDSAELLLSGQVLADRYHFDITQAHAETPNDISTDTVLWRYGDNLAPKVDTQGQGELPAPYLMLLATTRRLRLTYISTGGANVTISMHFRTHIPKDVLGQ